jgi:hypothetical protein
MRAAPLLQLSVPGGRVTAEVVSPGSTGHFASPSQAVKSWHVLSPSIATWTAVLRDAHRRGTSFGYITCTKPYVATGVADIGTNEFEVAIGMDNKNGGGVRLRFISGPPPATTETKTDARPTTTVRRVSHPWIDPHCPAKLRAAFTS